MKRIILIAAAATVLLTGLGAGAAFYLRPAFIFGASSPSGDAADSSSGAPQADRSGVKSRAQTLVETLGGLQDGSVRGDRSAIGRQKQMLKEIGTAIRYFEKGDWQDFANVRAALIYVLSGGDGSVLAPFINGQFGSDADRKLAEGIERFAQGRSEAAIKLIDSIDPRTLDVTLAGPFALARGSLHAADDAAKAILLFDEARLASPHTAIEEAAARREIPLLFSVGNPGRAQFLATDYVHRFGNSIYARKFYRSFAAELCKRTDLDEQSAIEGVLSALDDRDQISNSEMLLEMSGQALLRGRLVIARRAASEVLKLGVAPSQDLVKAKLYLASSDAPSQRARDAQKVLASLAAEQLSRDDTQIRDVADFLAQGVTRDIESAASGSSPEQVASNPIPFESELPRVNDALKDADAAVSHAELFVSRSPE